MDQRVAELAAALKEVKDVGGVGKVVFSQTGSIYRVKADLQTRDGRLALAFRRLAEAFRASVERLEGAGKK